MPDLLKIIKQAREKGVAIGHFNFAELTVLDAIVSAARRLDVSVIVGLSEKERAFFGSRWAARLVRRIREGTSLSLRGVPTAVVDDEAISKDCRAPRGGARNDGGSEGLPIFINADHTHSLAAVKEAVAAGFDAILFDGSRLPLAKNIRETRRAVEYIKSKNSRIVVEGELGYIGGSSQLLKKLPQGAAVRAEQLPSVEEARQFVEETGVDLLAPAVGSAHGIISGWRPRLDLGKIREIASVVSLPRNDGRREIAAPRLRIGACNDDEGSSLRAAAKQSLSRNDGVPIVLHGASGLSAASVRAAVRAGVSVVHINTEIRMAWRRALEQSLRADKNELAPYRILEKPRAAAEKVVERWIRLISNSPNSPN